MKAEIIGVGTELLLGSTINTDAADVAHLLSELGINVYWHTVVGDNPLRVQDAVNIARSRADLIITTGGLGPTCDDLTKNAVADAFGLPLEKNEAEERWLLQVFADRGMEFTPNNLQQVYLPRGAVALHNDWGTAPACAFQKDGCTVVMLPGPPRELRPLLEHRVRPYLTGLGDGVILSHSIRFFGIGESEMEYQLRDYMNSLDNPSLAPYVKEGECMVRVTAKAESEAKAEEMMTPVIRRVRDTFGALAYGMDCDSLAAYTLSLMREKGVTLAVAESCTGGELCKRLTDIPGASQVLLGGVTVYTNGAKYTLLDIPMDFIDAHGAVSREVGIELAQRVRTKLGADLGVGVTGLAGPEGDGVHPVGTVFLALSTADGTFVRECHISSRERMRVRLYACQNAYDMIRRYLSQLPVEEIDS